MAPDGPSARPVWRPLAAVVAAIAVLTIGGRLAAAAVGGSEPTTIGVEGVATVDPPEGWTEDVASRRVGDAPRFVLTKGSATVAVTVVLHADAAAPTLAETYVRDVLGDRFLQLAATPPQPISVGGVPGVRIVYGGSTPAPVEGMVTAAVAPDGSGIVIDGFAPEGLLAAVAADLDAMAEGAHLG